MISNRKKGRMAGVLFLILMLTGIFAEFFVRQGLFVSGNATATATNIQGNLLLFRLGIVSDIVMTVAYFLYALIVYDVFKPIDRNLSLAVVLSIVIAVTLLCVNTFNLMGVSLLLEDGTNFNMFEKGQLQGLSSFFLDMHTNGYFLAQVFYGLYLFPLGYMIFKSGLAPRVIGIFLMLGCIGDFISFFDFFLLPDHESIILQNITLPADIGEMSLCLWLIVKGFKDK